MSKPELIAQELREWLNGQIAGEEQLVGDLVKTHDLLRPDQKKHNDLSIMFGRKNLEAYQALLRLVDDVEGWKKRAGKMADILDEVDPVIVEFIADIKDYKYGGKEE